MSWTEQVEKDPGNLKTFKRLKWEKEEAMHTKCLQLCIG